MWGLSCGCFRRESEFYMEYTRFERARIVGARALQIAMGAPVLIEPAAGVVNPVDLALLEFKENIIPITVRRTVPPKAEPRKMAKAVGG